MTDIPSRCESPESIPTPRACEPLESRQLLSASLDDGKLLVLGSEGDDSIGLRSDGGEIVVTLNGEQSAFNAADVDDLEVRAGAGDDSINFRRLDIGILVAAMAGDDTVVGGTGDDSIGGNGGDDVLRGGAGADLISGCANHDTIYGNSGNDNLIGNQGKDVIYGNEGDDFIRARRSSDTVFGGKGDDQLHGGWAEDTVKGSTGKDDLTGGPEDDVLQQNPSSKPVKRADTTESWMTGGAFCSNRD